MKRLCALSLGTAAVVAPISAFAYCPCYTASSSYNTHNCGIEAVVGTNPTVAEWQPIFDLISKGPTEWPSGLPAVTNIGQGCGKPELSHNIVPMFPCELLKAIAMHESGWQQFCVPGLPADEKGKSSRTIISFDCGYGVGQVTSGMHKGETPAFDQQKVAGDPTYNLATSTQILAGKWKATNCVGDNQPKIIEDWYAAVWAYNGLAWSNNPNNPNLDAGRGVWDPAVGGSYAYQERVFGRVEHPNSSAYWTSVALAYPNRKDCGTTGKPPALPEPSCASPTDCSKTRSVHVSSCLKNSADAGTDSGNSDASTDSGHGDSAVDSGHLEASVDSADFDSVNDSEAAKDVQSDPTSHDSASDAAADSSQTKDSALVDAQADASDSVIQSTSSSDSGCSCSTRPIKERSFLLLTLASALAAAVSRRGNRRS